MDKETVVKLKDVAVYHADNPLVTLNARTYSSAGEKVLANLNLQVLEGEFVYFIGRVGSGKSSLLKMLYAELPLLEGEGEVAGFDLGSLKSRHIPHLRRNIGMVFQDLLLLTDRDVYDNLLCTLKATGWKYKEAIKERISEVLTLVGLENKEHKMPFELSGGERQRLVIARALLNSPKLILADEPTGNLDPVTADGIVRLFHSIAAQGTAVIMSTHNTSLIESYPARTILFSQGVTREVDVNEFVGTKSTI